MTQNTGSITGPKRHWLVLAGFVLLCLAVGSIAGWATNQSVNTWYLTLNRPSWTPPGRVFAPVWTVLYIMMGVASWRVWRTGGGLNSKARSALTVFLVQLALNFMWSFAFFAAKSTLLGLITIATLWLAVALTISVFRPIDRLAAWLLAPYLAWVSFAAALNFAFWVLN